MRRVAAVTLLTWMLSACGGSDEGSTAPAPADQAVAFQSDAAHSGVSGIVAPAFPASQAWSRTFVGDLSYPLVADGKVFVVEQPDASASGIPKLHAFHTSTGATAWGPVAVSATRQFAGAAYDKGRVVVANFDGLVLSLDASTGQTRWSTQLPNSYGFVSAPTVSAGFVYVSDGSTNRAFALDASTGALTWTAPTNGGGISIPSVGGGLVVIANPCQYYGLAASTGVERWHYNGPCSGGGGATVPVAGGAVYVRDFSVAGPFGPVIEVRDVEKGNLISRYAPIGLFSQVPIPAVSPTAAFLLEGSTLRRFDVLLTHAQWSFAGDGTLTTPPLVADTVVFVAGKSGTLFAVDSTTGVQRWSAPLPSTLDDANDAFGRIPVGLAAGEGHLIVPARNTLTAFRLVP